MYASKGYHGSTIEDICRAAYVSTRDFYAEFANREALLLALGEDLVREIYQAITEVEVEPGPQIVRRRTWARISGVLHTLVDDPRIARLALVETVGVSPEIEALRRGTHHLIADWTHGFVRDDLAAEGIDDERARLLTLGLVGATNELVADWRNPPTNAATSTSSRTSSSTCTCSSSAAPTADPRRRPRRCGTLGWPGGRRSPGGRPARRSCRGWGPGRRRRRW